MVKIKTKKEVKLPELIEWGFKQKELPPLFYGDKEGSLVQFTPGGWVNVTAIEPTDTFKVEIEESITEDTVIPKVIAVFKHNANLYTDRLFSKSINEILKLDDKVKGSVTKTIYVLNNDGTLTLIWRDGKLVE